jgi:hypothetical protein
MRKGEGKESMLCHQGTVLIDPESGLVAGCLVTPPCGLGSNAEVLAALGLAEAHMKANQSLVGDHGFDIVAFVRGLRATGMRAHPKAKSKRSQLDGRTTNKDCRRKSMKSRHKV